MPLKASEGLRICFVAPTLPGSGNHTTALRITHLLRAAGHEVQLVNAHEATEQTFAGQKFEACMYLHALRSGQVVWKNPSSSSSRNAKELGVSAPAHNGDHGDLELVPAVAAAAYILICGGTDVNERHGEQEEALMRAVVERSDAVVFFSEALAREASLKWGANVLAARRCVVISQAVSLAADCAGGGDDTERRSCTLNDFVPASKAAHVVVLPAGLRAVKGIAFAIDAWRRVMATGATRRHEVGVLFLGPPLEEECLEAVQQLVADEDANAFYSAEVTRSELMRLLGHPRILCVLNTSRSEGQPQAILEAMLIGNASCVVRGVPGNLAVVSSETGTIVQTPADAAKAICSLLWGERPAAMISAAKAYVQRQHNPNQEGALYAELLGSLMAQCKDL